MMRNEKIDNYTAYSYGLLSQNETVREYETDLCEKLNNIKNLEISTSFLTKLIKFPTFIRYSIETKRLEGISKELEKLKRSSVIYYCCEESGEIDTDLENAAKKFKPLKLLEFMDNNPIYANRVLVKKR